MYRQVLAEAPWIDGAARAAGEAILVNRVRAIERGHCAAQRGRIKSIAYAAGGRIVATPAEAPVKNLDPIRPDGSVLDWPKSIYIPPHKRVVIPSVTRSCPFTCSFCSQ